jgi:hypothetical protein
VSRPTLRRRPALRCCRWLHARRCRSCAVPWVRPGWGRSRPRSGPGPVTAPPRGVGRSGLGHARGDRAGDLPTPCVGELRPRPTPGRFGRSHGRRTGRVAQVARDGPHQPAQPVAVQDVLSSRPRLGPRPRFARRPARCEPEPRNPPRIGPRSCGWQPEEHVHQSSRQPLTCAQNQAPLTTKPALTAPPTVHQLRN